MGLHFIKNGTKHDVCVKRPPLFPASDTTYDNSQSGLAATRVQGAIDEVNEKVDGKVLASVTGDGVKTYATLLNEIASAIDYNDLTLKSKLVQYASNTGYACNCFILDAAWVRFVFIGGGASSVSIDQYDIRPNNSNFKSYVISSGSLSVTDKSSTAAGNTIAFKIFA